MRCNPVYSSSSSPFLHNRCTLPHCPPCNCRVGRGVHLSQAHAPEGWDRMVGQINWLPLPPKPSFTSSQLNLSSAVDKVRTMQEIRAICFLSTFHGKVDIAHGCFADGGVAFSSRMFSRGIFPLQIKEWLQSCINICLIYLPIYRSVHVDVCLYFRLIATK